MGTPVSTPVISVLKYLTVQFVFTCPCFQGCDAVFEDSREVSDPDYCLVSSNVTLLMVPTFNTIAVKAILGS